MKKRRGWRRGARPTDPGQPGIERAVRAYVEEHPRGMVGLASELGVYESYIRTAMRRGKISLDLACRLADLTGTPIVRLLTREQARLVKAVASRLASA